MVNEIKIKELIEKELKGANQIHPPFASQHEAWAVLLEEIEELDIESKKLRTLAEQMWHKIRADKDMREMLDDAERCAIAAIQEAIQVAAMCEKARNTEG